MHNSPTSNPATALVMVPLFFLALWGSVSFLISRVSGWALLANRFRTDARFPGPTWGWQSARMRWGCNYNNCLTVGSHPSGLYLSMMFLFRIGSPALLIPWPEVMIWRRRKVLFFEFVEFRLGREEQVPFTVRKKLADALQSAAGSSWPVEPVT